MPTQVYKGLSLLTGTTGSGGTRLMNALRSLADRIPPCNFTATSDPTATSDVNSNGGSGAGYYVGSRWYNTTTQIIWECLDNSAGAAKWVRHNTDDFVNVQSFGAKGDGSTNDAPAIQAAVNALSGTGKTLFFPPGTYNVATAVTWNGVTLKGAHVNATTLYATSQNTILSWTGEIQFAEISDLTFSGAVNGSNVGGKGIVGESLSHSFIRRCHFWNTLDDAIDLSVGVVNLTIEDSVWGYWGSPHGKHRQLHVASSTTLYVRRCYFTNSAGLNGVLIENAYGTEFQDSIFELNKATDSEVRIKGCDGFDFINCWFEANDGPYFIGLSINNALDFGARQVNFDRCWFNGTTNGGAALTAVVGILSGAVDIFRWTGNRGNVFSVPLTNNDSLYLAEFTSNYIFSASGAYTRDSRRFYSAEQWNTMRYASAAPTTGDWLKGDIVFNNNPSSGGFVGWVCTTAGTPGTWKTFGPIS